MSHERGQAPLGVRAIAVTRRFGEVEALRAVSIDAAPGEFVAVVGASGCGKTTLLRIIGGLDRPDEGRVEFFDAEGPVRAPGAFDLGFCFQEGRLLPWRCARDNAALPLELAGVPRAERRRRAEQALSLVRLGDRMSALPSELSGGMRMRVAMARAIVTAPRLLLLDEPFSSLDEVTRLELDGELAALRHATGATVLLVTHSILEAVLLADRVIVISRSPGRVAAECVVDLPERGLDRRRSPGLGPLSARILDAIGRPAESAEAA